ncbi:MAG: hypothetical protein M0Z94_06675 [Dehalococcoidales bacterium]|nr:hypothetical protein [Dehalococcoidales bacterium]
MPDYAVRRGQKGAIRWRLVGPLPATRVEEDLPLGDEIFPLTVEKRAQAEVAVKEPLDLILLEQKDHAVAVLAHLSNSLGGEAGHAEEDTHHVASRTLQTLANAVDVRDVRGRLAPLHLDKELLRASRGEEIRLARPRGPSVSAHLEARSLEEALYKALEHQTARVFVLPLG